VFPGKSVKNRRVRDAFTALLQRRRLSRGTVGAFELALTDLLTDRSPNPHA
jgi:hypothetical protein